MPSIDSARLRASPSFSRRDMGSKAMPTTASLSGTDIWRAESRRRQTCGRSTSSRANCSMQCESRASRSVPGISAKTSRRRARSRDAAAQYTASHRQFGEPSADRSAHALRSHRSLPVRIDKPITGRHAESALPGRCHGGRVRRRRNITRRSHPRHPSRPPSSASSSAVNSLAEARSAACKIVDLRSQAIGHDVERRKRNRQLESPPSRAAGIEVEDAADRFDLRYVGMPRDDHVDAGARIGLQRLEVVQDIDRLPSKAHACRVRVFAGPLAIVHVSTDGA